LLVGTAVVGLGVGAVLLFPWVMLPDVLEFDALARGAAREQRDGLLYAGFTFVQKLAFALASALNGVV
jgi:Na+/melibiose symporter-like transporter